MPATKPPIVVALSGGVDSATAAAMLVEQGERVVGMTMRLYDAGGTVASAGGRCCGPRDIEDARRVCAHLDIPFYVVDFEREFSERVIDEFVDAYIAGETPNPCVKCNQFIKFTPLLKRARALGAELLATGHYARIEPAASGEYRLMRGVDAGKDQSYFLFSMPRHELASIRFPLGGLGKDEVRALATTYGLPNAAKAESQEICFVPDGDYAGFVEKHAAKRGRSLPIAGQLTDTSGTAVGEHAGIHRYTIGQRRGLGNVAGGERVYVVDIDPASGDVVVGPRDAAARPSIRVRDVCWLSAAPAQPIPAMVQVRHRARPVAADVVADGADAVVTFADSHVVAAPGQSAVFYDGDAVLGGGWITRPAA